MGGPRKRKIVVELNFNESVFSLGEEVFCNSSGEKVS